ncbi:DUF6891 domain-containing protein [Streptomyces sp. NPDC021093]|uniref:DUF6891 domain-containing protein n=1 Tax=Streptomyces sp. NPDC021093 TaxID=3365112 RepID=UPI0037931DF3
MSDILDISVKTESGAVEEHLTADRLTALVHRIGGDDDHFLVVRRIPADPASFVQVWHDDGGAFEVEHRDGGPERHFAASLADVRAVADVLCGWARGERGWGTGIPWEQQDHTPPPPDPEPIPELPDELRAEVEEYAAELVDGGYESRTEIARDVHETYEDDGLSYPQTWLVVDRLWNARLAEQEEWEGRTDPERVGEAFAALGRAGITAREHFACCRACGLAEIGAAGAEGAESEGEGAGEARGFVFFHTQGTAVAVAGGGLSLYYGGFAKSPEVTAAVGREVVAALAEAGLTVEWDGSPDKSILLPELEWRKRLVD